MQILHGTVSLRFINCLHFGHSAEMSCCSAANMTILPQFKALWRCIGQFLPRIDAVNCSSLQPTGALQTAGGQCGRPACTRWPSRFPIWLPRTVAATFITSGGAIQHGICLRSDALQRSTLSRIGSGRQLLQQGISRSLSGRHAMNSA